MSAFKEKVIENFDKGAFCYDEHADIQKKIAIDLSGEIKNSPQTILEIGCGTGFLTKILRDKFPKSKITAVDIAPQMVLQCQQKFIQDNNIFFNVMDGENIQSNQHFDLIISSMTFQWFEDFPKAIKSLQKFQSPQGKFYYALPSARSFHQWRTILLNNKFQSGLIDMPKQKKIIETKTYNVNYESGYDFLNHMKKIGAHTTIKGYQKLSYHQIKTACKEFDEGSKEISWVIDFCSVE